MKEKSTPQMTTLDQMVNDDSLQMMKAAIPYVSPNGRKTLSLLTKFMELRKTMSMFNQPHMDIVDHVIRRDYSFSGRDAA